MLPNFFVVGAQKSATTSLHFYLSEHPDIFLPKEKESKFFVNDHRYILGIKHYEERHFSEWKGQKVIGEVDPDYMYFEVALERIMKHFDIKKLRFVFIFRNPVDRAFSHYLMTARRGMERLPFAKAIECEEERIKRDYRSKMHFSYVDRGFYYKQVMRFFRYVDRSQMLFLLYEDLVESPIDSLEMVFKFLNVSDKFVPPNLNNKFNPSRVPRNVILHKRLTGNGIEKRIVRFFLPWTKYRHKLLEKIINLNLSSQHEFYLCEKVKKDLSLRFKDSNEALSKLINRDLDYWMS
jgi:hypothetical protein